MTEQEIATNRTRRKAGITMMVVGLASWLTMMIIIVYRNTTVGEVPTRSFLVGTFLCWVVFFAGKSILKFHNNKLEPKAPPTE